MGEGGEVIGSLLYTIDLLIDTIEALGMHSIQTSELKQLIGAVRPLENGKLVRCGSITYMKLILSLHQPTYYYRLQKAMTLMADSGSEGVSPLHYFDLRMEDSVRTLPHTIMILISSFFPTLSISVFQS